MKTKQSIASIICGILVASSVFMFNAYAKSDDEGSIVTFAINSIDELNEVDKCLQKFEGGKIKLTSDKKAKAKVAALTTLQNEQDEKEARKRKLSAFSDKETVKPIQKTTQANRMPTMKTYNLDEAKKVYRYSETIIEKIKNNTSLDDEIFSWQIPIVNSLDENGIIHLKKSDIDEELVANSLEFPADNRELFLSNEEIIDLVGKAIDNTASIEAIYFVDMPISIMGRVVAAVTLDSGDIMFATVQDMPYYNGMEFRQVYTFDEMMDYLEVFEKKAQGWINNSHLQ